MKKAAALLVLALASVALVACGSSSSSTETESSGGESASGAEKPAEEGGGGEGGGAIVDIATPAGTELAFTTKAASAPAGQVSIEFENPQALQHDVTIEDSSGKVVAARVWQAALREVPLDARELHLYKLATALHSVNGGELFADNNLTE